MPESRKNHQKDGSNPNREETSVSSAEPSLKSHLYHPVLKAIHLVIALCVLLRTVNIDAKDASSIAQRPNIIFILADDLGWSELGCYGNTFNETPHIDALATEGVRFTQAYAAAPVCSPYRAALLTGQYPARIGISDYLRPNSANALSTEHTTLAEAMRDGGYATGMIGKWHLTGYLRHEAEIEITPRDHGFTWDFARELKGVSNGVNFWPYLDRKQRKRWIDIPHNELGREEFLVDRMNHEAIRFIERNKNRPFFLYLTHYATHSIVHGKPELVEKYRNKHTPGKSSKTRCVICSGKGLKGCPEDHWATSNNPHLAAMLESIDDGVGLITTKLEELGLKENTIVIFTSDNGGESNVTSNAPLRGGKSQLYEGGIRVPMIVHWPNGLPASATSRTPTMNIDFYPTLLEAAGIFPPTSQHLDGTSMLADWQRPGTNNDRESLFWHYPLDRPHFLGGVSGAAIRHQNWKLIEFFDSNTVELYSLQDDPSETNNLARKQPIRVAELRRRIEQWRKHVAARTPSSPILTEVRHLHFADHFSSGRTSVRWDRIGDWSLESGYLVHKPQTALSSATAMAETNFREAIIRFDFQLGETTHFDVFTRTQRNRTPILQIHRNGFRVPTTRAPSKDQALTRYHDCVFRFEPDRWYTMTLELVDEYAIAHIDHQHFAYTASPEQESENTLFSIRATGDTAKLDNIQIVNARRHPHHEERLKSLFNNLDQQE